MLLGILLLGRLFFREKSQLASLKEKSPTEQSAILELQNPQIDVSELNKILFDCEMLGQATFPSVSESVILSAHPLS